MDIQVLIVIPSKRPGERVGVVHFYESGYYPTYIDDPLLSVEELEAFVAHWNLTHYGISEDVARSAMEASMFGWHVPAANPATEFFKAKDLERSRA